MAFVPSFHKPDGPPPLPGPSGQERNITLNLLALFTVIGSGTLSYAPHLDTVAERRIQNHWGLETIELDELPIAIVDCEYLGRSGWLFVPSRHFVNDRVRRVRIVDCSQERHKKAMVANGLLADTNDPELTHLKAWLVLQ